MNRPPNQYIAPVQEPYGYIIFRASEVKDLSVDEPPPAQSQHNVHDDPAVLGVRSFSFSLSFSSFYLTMMKSFGCKNYNKSESAKNHVEFSVAFLLIFFFFLCLTRKCIFEWRANLFLLLYFFQASAAPTYLPPGGVNNVPNAPPLNQQPPTTYVAQQQQTPAPAPAIQQLQPQTSQQPQAASATPAPETGNQIAPNPRRPNPVHSAAASLETVERALGDLRVNGGGSGPIPTHPNRGGRRGPPRAGRITEVEQITVPTTDFDFQGSNAKFEKASRSPAPAKDDNTNGEASGETINSEAQEGEKDQVSLAYNKSTSFFDSLSSSADAPAPAVDGTQNGGGRGRRGGGSLGRNRREEERERNVATIGEPGGVGLLGPGGYVGGWGGYGRRGGRPRRGARGSGHAVPAQ